MRYLQIFVAAVLLAVLTGVTAYAQSSWPYNTTTQDYYQQQQQQMQQQQLNEMRRQSQALEDMNFQQRMRDIQESTQPGGYQPRYR